MPQPARVQVVPQWHKQLYEFQRIRCTKCITSPDNQKKRDHTCKSCACLVHCDAKVAAKTEVSEVWHNSTLQRCIPLGSQGRQERQDISEKVQNGKASCCPLLKRITKLKCVNSGFMSVNIDPTTEVASRGPMAPCRSHHRNHTRQEWTII